MKYTPDYTITLSEGRTVPLLFKTWATKHFCLEQGFKVEEMYGNLDAAKIDAIFLKGHECYCKYNDLPFLATELDACDWIDTLGGYNGKGTMEVIEIFLAKSAGKTLAEYREMVEVVSKAPKKKKEAEAESPNAL
jgi:hypothetical protein